jgi:hypothetical protein
MKQLIVLLLIFVLLVPAVSAQDCSYFDPQGHIGDDNVPVPNTDHCDNNGRLQLVCNQAEVTAFVDGYFYLTGDYDTEVSEEFYLSSGGVARFNLPPSTEWVQLWYGSDLVGIIDNTERDCTSNVTYPPDNRINWQQGDSFFAAFVVDGWLDVYATETGTGVLILHTQEPACSEDGSACYDGYYLTLIDPEGKVYVVEV